MRPVECKPGSLGTVAPVLRVSGMAGFRRTLQLSEPESGARRAARERVRDRVAVANFARRQAVTRLNAARASNGKYAWPAILS